MNSTEQLKYLTPTVYHALKYFNSNMFLSYLEDLTGMGSLFINAVYFVDIPIMSAYMIMVAFIFVMINFIVDITYYFIDPRIRLKEESN